MMHDGQKLSGSTKGMASLWSAYGHVSLSKCRNRFSLNREQRPGSAENPPAGPGRDARNSTILLSYISQQPVSNRLHCMNYRAVGALEGLNSRERYSV